VIITIMQQLQDHKIVSYRGRILIYTAGLLLLVLGHSFFPNNSKSQGHSSVPRILSWADPKSTAVRSYPPSLAWELAMQQAKEMLAPNTIGFSNSFDPFKASCMIPDTTRTEELVKFWESQGQQDQRVRGTLPTAKSSLVPLPILNMGMPKLGSSTLTSYFSCKGFIATHWTTKSDKFEGLCMRDAVRIGLPPLQTCSPNNDAFLQMDVEFPVGFAPSGVGIALAKDRDDCFFPQLSILEEIHDESPDATFIINFRPMKDWIKSVVGWGMMDRLEKCHLPNLPYGVPGITDGETGQALEATMAQFFCSHVQHVRNFVNTHPTHTLIELDLYNTNQTIAVLDRLFRDVVNNEKGISKSCWGQSNKSKYKQN